MEGGFVQGSTHLPEDIAVRGYARVCVVESGDDMGAPLIRDIAIHYCNTRMLQEFPIPRAPVPQYLSGGRHSPPKAFTMSHLVDFGSSPVEAGIDSLRLVSRKDRQLLCEIPKVQILDKTQNISQGILCPRRFRGIAL